MLGENPSKSESAEIEKNKPQIESQKVIDADDTPEATAEDESG